MKPWGRLRLLALACLLAAVLSLPFQGPTSAQMLALEPAPAYLADRPAVREIARAAQAEGERLRRPYAVYVYGVAAGFAFEVSGHFYLPARLVIGTLGGLVKMQPQHRLQIQVADRPTITVPMYYFLDRGYVRLDEVRQVLPQVKIDQQTNRVLLGTPERRPALPSTDGGLRAVWLDDQIFSTRGLLAGGELYVPLPTAAQALAASSRYDASAGTGFLEGQPIDTFFSSLPDVAGMPYVRLGELLDRLHVQASVRTSPAGRVDRLITAGPGLPATASPSQPLPEGSVVYGLLATGSSKPIALTFDDYLGPWIPKLLNTLRQLDVRATFFAIGSSVKAHPDQARDIVAAGHQIASHTFNHYDGYTMTMAELRAELAGTRRAIREATGVDSRYWRPPGGYVNAAAIEQAALPLGLTTVLWSVNSNDSNPKATEADVHSEVMKQAFPGAIVAMHMGSAATAAALPRIVRDLRAQGYSFVTVEQLLAAPAAVRDRSQG